MKRKTPAALNSTAFANPPSANNTSPAAKMTIRWARAGGAANEIEQERGEDSAHGLDRAEGPFLPTSRIISIAGAVTM